MKRLEVRISATATSDLDAIGLHVFKRTLNAGLARAYTGRIRNACERIGDAPYGGAPRDDIGAGIRSWAFERRAVILYRVTSKGVSVVRVIHRGRQVRLVHATARDT